MSGLAVAALIMAGELDRRRNIEERRIEEHKKKEQQTILQCQELLINSGGNISMEIGVNETIKMLNIIKEDHKWSVRLAGEEILGTLDECVSAIVNVYKPSGIQLVPLTVNSSFGCVSKFGVLIKTKSFGATAQ